MNKFLPDFKRTCLLVGISFVLMPLSLFIKGLMPSMADFRVPEVQLISPHYYDAILWVYVHMMVIGCLIIFLGFSVEDRQKQRIISFILFLITAVYVYLDFRSSDSLLGNGLYKGEASLIPGFIGLLVNLLFLQLSIRLFRK